MQQSHDRQPLIFAHRGACRVAPENTLPAFLAAMDLGADGVELDVQYSSDGKLMVIHNPSLEATTNGTGRVTAHTFDELRALDAGAHFAAEFAGTPIPTLDEVLELAAGRLLVNIELKALDAATSSIGADVVACVIA
ncbi:MAG: glycerophosphodiester phosphodiesterase, partial [Anaerolineae bacterium]